MVNQGAEGGMLYRTQKPAAPYAAIAFMGHGKLLGQVTHHSMLCSWVLYQVSHLTLRAVQNAVAS